MTAKYTCWSYLPPPSPSTASPHSAHQNTAEFSADVRLVFSNARLYNSDPTSSVHAAARELYELFEAKFAALGPNLDDPPLKRKKSAGGSAFSNVAGGDCEHEPERDRKRKSSGGGKSGGDGGGGGSGTKKARAAAAAAAAPAPAPVMAVAPPPPPPAAAPAPSLAGEFSGGEVPASMLKMQRKIEEMEAQIRRMQGQAVAAQQPQVILMIQNRLCLYVCTRTSISFVF